MRASNENACKAFVRGARSGESWTGNLHFDYEVLWSYRAPIGIRLKDGWILASTDRYSTTTSKHQSYLVHSGSYVIPASFNALQQVISRIVRSRQRNIPVGYSTFLLMKNNIQVIDTTIQYDFALPLTVLRLKTSEDCVQYGGLIDECLLCGQDGRSHFCSWLPGPASSVTEACEMLKPPQVKEAEAAGMEVLRQGEFFFIKVAEKGQAYEVLGVGDRAFHQLPIQNNEGEFTPHKARLHYLGGRWPYATGTVFHGLGDHPKLKLNGYYRVVQNAAQFSASASWAID